MIVVFTVIIPPTFNIIIYHIFHRHLLMITLIMCEKSFSVPGLYKIVIKSTLL